jgi:glycosyltransferase involved in cell wall biosynthesis
MVSVIVVSYEGRKHLKRILDSLVKQHYAGMEVVISDDCSEDTCDDIVGSFRDRLKIIRTSTKTHSGYPSDTRQAGLEAARGDWITFADQDDAFYPGAISQVTAFIRKNPEANVIRTEFDEVDPETEKPFRHHAKVYGWTHGTFIRREWMEKNHIRYKAGMKSHEDIYLSTLIVCALQAEGGQEYYCPVNTYRWYAWNSSLSHKEDRLFIENHLGEYIEATGDAYIENYERRGEPAKEFSRYHAVSVVLYCYFYHMGCVFRNLSDIIKENSVYISEYIKKVKEAFGMTNDELLIYCARDRGTYFWKTMELAEVATGPYIPCLTLEQYLSLMAWEGADDLE